MGQNYDLENAPSRLLNLIQAIGQRRPESHIIVAKITPFAGDWNNVNQVEPLNLEIQDWVVPNAIVSPEGDSRLRAMIDPTLVSS